jgi:predicted DNA-binding transcriptional regulator YafY
MEAETETVTFELTNRWKALDRVLLHFSHLEKETRRLDEGKYLVKLKYDKEDENEIISRILSFGSVIRVLEPESIVIQIRSRIEKQMQLAPLRKNPPDTDR